MASRLVTFMPFVRSGCFSCAFAAKVGLWQGHIGQGSDLYQR